MTCKTKVVGANLYLTIAIGDSIILTFGEQKAYFTFAERSGAKEVRIGISAPREIKIERGVSELIRNYKEEMK